MVEIEKNCTFSIVGVEGVSVMVKTGYLISPTSARRASVEKARVLIPVHGDAEGEALLPVGKFFRVNSLKTMDSKTPKTGLSTSQTASFLKEVQGINENFSVILTLIDRTDAPLPRSASTTTIF